MEWRCASRQITLVLAFALPKILNLEAMLRWLHENLPEKAAENILTS